MGLYSQLRCLASMFMDLFSSDGNDPGWALILMLPIGLLVLLVWLGWALSTSAAPKKVAHSKPTKWVGVLLFLLLLFVPEFYTLSRS